MPDMDHFTATCSEDRDKEIPKYLSEKSPEKASTQRAEGAMHPSCCRWSPRGAEQQALGAGHPLVPANTCPALARHTQNCSPASRLVFLSLAIFYFFLQYLFSLKLDKHCAWAEMV